MSFVYPAFLSALLVLVVPIIIHLFNFRQFKKIYFSNVRLLKEVKHESQSRWRLKHLLVLLTRLMGLSFLVFAFSQPFLPPLSQKGNSLSAGNETIGVFIDNSFSMDAVNNNGRLFDQGLQIARQIVNAHPTSSSFLLLSNDFTPLDQRSLNKDDFLKRLDETESSSSSKKVSSILSRWKETSDIKSEDSFSGANSEPEVKKHRKILYVISDFQKTICDFKSIPADSDFQVVLVPIASTFRNNLFIDSCWFATPARKLNVPDEIHLRIVNKSDNLIENVPIKFIVNGQIRALGTIFSVPANSGIDTVLNFTSTTPGFQSGKAEITDFPLTFDDTYFISYQISPEVNILSIAQNSTNVYLETLFRPQDEKDTASLQGKGVLFSLRESSISNINYSSFPLNNLIILSELDSIPSGLSQELQKFVENGGSTMIFPPKKINLSSYHEFLSQLNVNFFEFEDTFKTKVSQINFENELFENVFESGKMNPFSNIDLPVVYKQYKVSRISKTNEDWLMKTMNENHFLSRYKFGKGFIYLSSVPLAEDFSNFPKHALFLPTLYQIALNSIVSARDHTLIIGSDDFFEISNPGFSGNSRENIFHIFSENKTVDFIPQVKTIDSKLRLLFHNQITQSGNYSYSLGKDELGSVSFNYDRKESDPAVFSISELKEKIKSEGLYNFSTLDPGIKNLESEINESTRGISLWKYCLIFALAFFAAEVALIKWLK